MRVRKRAWGVLWRGVDDARKQVVGSGRAEACRRALALGRRAIELRVRTEEAALRAPDLALERPVLRRVHRLSLPHALRLRDEAAVLGDILLEVERLGAAAQVGDRDQSCQGRTGG